MLPEIERGEVTRVSQDEREATYAPILKREDGLVDWRMSAREIANRVRAFQPWPGAYTQFRGARLTIWRAREAEASGESTEPGAITGIDKSAITVTCGGSTSLAVEELQAEGKRKMSARDFVNGMRISAGDRFIDAQP